MGIQGLNRGRSNSEPFCDRFPTLWAVKTQSISIIARAKLSAIAKFC
ncbi:hypothetical protein J0895_15365 [Phormidium pseudopriestleyi FRX01]|uniref:Uncharacterized protein n=1 Tax=Phormidium pseudopriestleyi FRX01 TaxID=1759528 RepID=A0ABS3FTK3_9CYAN|nr:hypothetical protein [Phormidium pseudopriestleyi]MBO0350449.1 hypothetical protein [Phormidium pseudopriestleyi FRX01]